MADWKEKRTLTIVGVVVGWILSLVFFATCFCTSGCASEEEPSFDDVGTVRERAIGAAQRISVKRLKPHGRGDKGTCVDGFGCRVRETEFGGPHAPQDEVNGLVAMEVYGQFGIADDGLGCYWYLNHVARGHIGAYNVPFEWCEINWHRLRR